MKKRIISIILAAAIAVGFSCTGALAAKKEVTEINVDNIYQMALDNNPNITILSNSIYIMGLTGLYTPADKLANTSQITSMTVSKKQIAYGAQQLLINYYKVVKSKDLLELNIAQFEKSLKVSKVMCDIGMMSKVEYDALVNSYNEMKNSLATLKINIGQIETSLKTMINLDPEDEIKIAPFEPVSEDIVNTLNRESCYNEAMQNNYNVRATFASYDGAHITNEIANGTQATELALDSAKLTYRNAKINAQTAFDNQWNGIISKRDAVKLAKQKLDSAKVSFDVESTKFASGAISPLDYSKAETAYKTAEIDYENAKIDFLATYKKFEALLQGIALD